MLVKKGVQMAQRAKMLAEKVQVAKKEQRGDREESTLTSD